jgi:hypothetical protein
MERGAVLLVGFDQTHFSFRLTFYPSIQTYFFYAQATASYMPACDRNIYIIQI